MTEVQARPGRPRSADVDRAIIGATLDLLVDEGYNALTVEAVAARAGVGKTTVYRRWANKERAHRGRPVLGQRRAHADADRGHRARAAGHRAGARTAPGPGDVQRPDHAAHGGVRAQPPRAV